MNALERAVVDAAIEWNKPQARWCGSEEQALEAAVSALLAERERIAAKPCVCGPGDEVISCESANCRVKLGAIELEHVWVERTWTDVREGDVIRPPGQEAHAAIVVKRGPVNHWHVAPNTRAVPMEWASIDVTMRPLTTGDVTKDVDDFTPANGMNPDAAVEIQVTREELAAIEALGGWSQRIGVTTD